MTLRALVFWPHLVAGTLAGAAILLMSVTGVLLTYERQLIAWSDSHLRSTVSSPGAQRVPVDVIAATMRRAYPGQTPASITIAADPTAPVAVAIPQRTVYLDAYSGVPLGEGSRGMRQAMSTLRSWHRWMAVEGDGRATARALTGWANVLFAFIVLSGIYLWFPRTWTWVQFRTVLLFNGRARAKARDFNWHNVIGVWSAVPLFIVAVSAVPISFPWANAAIYQAVGEPVPAGRGGGAGGRSGGGRGEPATAAAPVTVDGLERLLVQAAAVETGWRTIQLRLPATDDAPAVFAIDRGDGGQPHLRSTLTLTRATGAVESHETFGSLTLGRRIRNTMRFAHTGEVLGLPGQTIAGLVTAGSIVLVWTGFALAWRRFRAWFGRSRRPQPSSVASPAA